MKKKVWFIPSGWLGDTILATAVIRNIIDSGLYEINVDHQKRGILWENYPGLNPKIDAGNADYIYKMHNGDRWDKNCRHLIEGVTADFAYYVGQEIPCRHKKPEIHIPLPKDRIIPFPYVLILTGWQNSAETKKWSQTYWQNLINLAKDVRFVQVGQEKNHAYPLCGTVNMIDQTNLQQLTHLVRDAACVISPPSGIVHIAKAYETPSIAITGGREPAGLTQYSSGVAISTIGQFQCCQNGGCHMNHFTGDKRVCKMSKTVGEDGIPTSQCMLEITPEMVFHELQKIMTQKAKSSTPSAHKPHCLPHAL